MESRGKVMVGGGVNNPCEGLLVRKVVWHKITRRPLGLARAKRLADEQPHHAVVCEWGSARVFYDNGKPARLPEGWWPEDAYSALDPRRRAALKDGGS